MNKEDLIKLINKMYGNEIDEKRKTLIIDKVIMFDKYVELSPMLLINVIDNFIKIEKIGYIDKVNEDLFILIKNIISKNNEKVKEEDALYILDYLNYLVIPYNIIKCENKSDLTKFLGEFEILVSYIEDDDSFLDMEKIRTYNDELYNIICFRVEWVMKNINNETFKSGSIQDQLLVETTLSHLMAIYYFSLDKYNNDLDILKDSYDIIINNYDKLKIICRERHLYNDILSINLMESNILDEFEFCKEILDGLMEKNKKKVKK